MGFSLTPIPGTISLTQGSKTVTGTGTVFTAYQSGWLINVLGHGLAQIGADPASDTELTLLNPWPLADVADAAYEAYSLSDGAVFALRNRQLLQKLNTLSGTGLHVDALGLFADRASHDDEAQGFVFLSLDGSGGQVAIYIKASAAAGDWTALPFTGPQGDPGLIGDWRGAWATGTAYAVNDAVQEGGSSYICVTAHISGVFADDLAAGKWEVVAQKGDTGPQGQVQSIVAGSGISVDDTDPANPAVSIAAPLGGFRNKIINGDFDIWQRGTSFSSPSSASYTADRWFITYDETGGTRTISRQAHTLGQTDVPGNPQYFLRYAVSAAGSGGTFSDLAQHVEGVRTLAGKKVTVTFYAKASAALTLANVFLRQDFGNGGSPSFFVNLIFATNISIGTTWQKVQYTGTLGSISGKTIGSNNDDKLTLFIAVPTNATFTLDISHVSLVEGDATSEDDPFSPRHIGQELALCQRYYEKSFAIGTAPASAVGQDTGELAHNAIAAGAASVRMIADFAVRKRAVPTITTYNPMAAGREAYNIQKATSCSGTASSGAENRVLIGTTTPSSTAQNDSIRVHWTADAEL